ncbi:NADase-type glycan-binding domain-containing protein [Streptomyces sp. NPDC020192]|uniref:NADase-type glycan-binding domain-containing protein n=1 Tax=Streptomyces sp. NPDC020192 TaxID=3365066 RepID=UPI0037A6FA36
MRACPVCGASNDPTDDFCGNCGSYLGWSEEGSRGTSAPAPPAAHGPTAAANSHTTHGSSESAAGTDGEEHRTEEHGPTTSRTPATTSNTPPAPAPPVRPERPVPTPAPPQTEAVGPVQPAKPVAPRPVVRAVAGPEEVSGVPCPVCGTPNPPGRRFCRRCASPLTPAADRDPLPWWRTIWPFRRQVRAGSGRWIRLLVVLAVILALCVGGFFLLPAGRALFEDTRDKLGGAKAVTPVEVHASAEAAGHPAKDTTDGLSNRYWGAPGAGASITYTFGKPFRLVDLIITNGASTDPEEYAREARALRMKMEVTSADGTVHPKEIDLSDKPGTQTIATGVDDVVKVRLVLGAVTGLTAQRHVALAEVEFFQRS